MVNQSIQNSSDDAFKVFKDGKAVFIQISNESAVCLVRATFRVDTVQEIECIRRMLNDIENALLYEKD